MLPDSEFSGSNRRIQSLVQICQRAAGNHIESISSLGELPFSLVKPILERCSVEQLLRVEEASPHLKRDSDSEELWRSLCLRTYPAIVREDDAPESWRAYFFVLREAEAKRLEEVASRIRTQRREADERKKEREVKLTDRMPPPKRQRTGWNTPSQPKTLFQKTRSEASKLQKNMYNTRMIPPMPKGKTYTSAGSFTNSTLSPPQSVYSNRVTVSTVIRRQLADPSNGTESLDLASSKPLTSSTSPSKASSAFVKPDLLSPSTTAPAPRKTVPPSSSISNEKVLAKPFTVPKKDPMASLFVPKHRAYSQRTR